MKAQFTRSAEDVPEVSPSTRVDDGFEGHERERNEDNTQLIYVHLPPAVVLATEQHLRAQTNIEQRAHEIWFTQGCRPGSALGDWLRAEYEVAQKLCQALLCRNHRESETGFASHEFMNHDIPDLQIHIHKVDGSTTIFFQNDAGEAKRLLDEFQPELIFSQDRITFMDEKLFT